MGIWRPRKRWPTVWRSASGRCASRPVRIGSTPKVAWTERWRATAPFALTGLELNIGFGHYDVSPGTPFTVALPGVNAD